MSVKCNRARVVGVGEIYLLVSRYGNTLVGVTTYVDIVTAHQAARFAALRHNRHLSFAVLTLRLPAEIEGTVYTRCG